MKIGALAAAAQTPVQTIRYYERQALLPTAARTAGNYRIYGPVQVQRLAFIRHCRSLDMTLDEIRMLLRVKDEPQAECAEVNALLDEHIGHVAARMRELKQLDRQLRLLRQQCAGGTDAAHCGILAELSQTASAAPKQPGAPTEHVHGAHGKRPGHGLSGR